VSGRRLSATADRPRRHLRLIRGRPLLEQLAVAATRELQLQRKAIEQGADIERVIIVMECAEGLVDRVHVAIERAQITARTGTAG
jgi:hypothetical protein